MTTFDKRKDAFEKRFAHDEELRFKASARRNKQLGLWAAGLLGKTGAEAETYAKEVVAADFEEAGDEDVFRKIRGGFRRRRRRPVGPPDPPHHGRTDGEGDRADPQRSDLSRRAARLRRTRHGSAFARRSPEDRRLPLYRPGSPCPSRWWRNCCARAGFDCVTLDMQHGLHDPVSVMRSISGVALAGKPALVRMPVGDFAMASRALDMGAEGVIAPMINSVADAKAFVAATKYPPIGDRSWGPLRAQTHLRHRSADAAQDRQRRLAGVRHDRDRAGARCARRHPGARRHRRHLHRSVRPLGDAVRRPADRAGRSDRRRADEDDRREDGEGGQDRRRLRLGRRAGAGLQGDRLPLHRASAPTRPTSPRASNRC